MILEKQYIAITYLSIMSLGHCFAKCWLDRQNIACQFFEISIAKPSLLCICHTKSYTRFNGFFWIADSTSKYIVNIHKKLSESYYTYISIKLFLYSGNNHKERNVLLQLFLIRILLPNLKVGLHHHYFPSWMRDN